jgi:UDP-N-acetylmuramate dehydrogenase
LKKSDCEYRENFDLAPYSSARLPAVIKAVVYPDDETKVVNLIANLEELNLSYIVVGGLSNLLIKNGYYDGVVVKTDKIATKYLAENQATLGCGIRMSSVITEMASRNLGGMEGLAGIPGTVGGMVKQNAGAFGYEISDRFVEAVCYIPKEKSVKRFSKVDMDFSYRHSLFSEKSLILLSASFDFLPKSREEILSKMKEFRHKRLETQPIQYPSLGSVFKRYNGTGAGFYIDKCGLKGFSVGGAMVSQKHAGFIVNRGGATADDYIRVVEHIKKRVYAVFGIELEEEIEIV